MDRRRYQTAGFPSTVHLSDLPSEVTVPTLVVYYTGDNCIYPGETRRLFEASPAADKQLHAVEGDHFGLPLRTKPNPPGGRERALQIITGWLRERFPR